MHKHGLKRWVVPCAVLASVWVKWSIGLGSYSGQLQSTHAASAKFRRSSGCCLGQGTPPMYGDYEAQRHWMELTIHLPPREWYTYDLQYWGLDYPPLTAYVSWLCGVVYVHAYCEWPSVVTHVLCSGARIDPSWFALESSRGIESPGSTTYMRTTVLVFDTLVYLPALFLFVRSWHTNRSTRTQVQPLCCVTHAQG